jgi:hypothetical protein
MEEGSPLFRPLQTSGYCISFDRPTYRRRLTSGDAFQLRIDKRQSAASRPFPVVQTSPVRCYKQTSLQYAKDH